MSTPLQRARTKLRVMYRLQQAARDHQEQRRIEEGDEQPHSPVANGVEADAAVSCPMTWKSCQGVTTVGTKVRISLENDADD